MHKLFAKFTLFLFINIFAIFNSYAAISNWHYFANNNVSARALATKFIDQKTQKISDNKLLIAVEFKIKKDWKIYSYNSLDVGIEPQFYFDNNIVKNHKIFWPQPIFIEEKFDDLTLSYNIYQDHIIIPVVISSDKKIANNNFNFTIDFGLCKEICLSESQKFSVNLSNEIDQDSLKLIKEFAPQNLNKIISQNNIKNNSHKSFFFMIFIAFIGGAILNIMPCVLPVLSIKLLSIIKQRNSKIAEIKSSFLATIFGILTCFLIFAVTAIIIKLLGSNLGWGLQFQNPYFLITLIIILIFFTANLLGIYQINIANFLINILNNKIDQNTENKQNFKQNFLQNFLGNYLSGILAVILATPCSAPFLGTAISFALTQEFYIIFIIFGFIGIGFSLPYIILLINPQMVYLLPKSGKWINNFKQIMTGLLMATIFWLIYVLISIIGYLPAIITGLLAILLIPTLKLSSRIIKNIIIIFVTIGLFTIPFALKHNFEKKEILYNEIWQEFDEKKIENYVNQGYVVVINITASWCSTCKFNEFRVLKNKEILQLLKSKNIIPLQGDISKPNPEIMKFLEKYNRFGVPFNAVFGPMAPEGIITSEFLSKDELIKAINKAK